MQSRWGEKKKTARRRVFNHCLPGATSELDRRWRRARCEHRRACDQIQESRGGVRSGSGNITDCFTRRSALLTRSVISAGTPSNNKSHNVILSHEHERHLWWVYGCLMVHDAIATFLKHSQTHLELADACSMHPTFYYLCVSGIMRCL